MAQSSPPSPYTVQLLKEMFKLLIPVLSAGVLIMLFGCLQLLPSLPLFFSYTQGECTVTGGTSEGIIALYQKKWQMRYTPIFSFTLRTTDQQIYRDTGYKTQPEPTSYEQSEAALNSYQYGQTYPCWYNPANPTQAVLDRSLNTFGVSLVLIGLGIDVFFLLLWGKFFLIPVIQRNRGVSVSPSGSPDVGEMDSLYLRLGKEQRSL